MSGSPRLALSRAQILAYRRAAGALNDRLATGANSLRRAAWAGLQDSMPRAALLSLHARVHGIRSDTWEHPALVQIWGPRYSVYVVAAEDRAIFTLGRLPDDVSGRRFAQETADLLEGLLDGRRMTYTDAGHALGRHPNSLRYAAPTGRVLVRWEGARRPTIWTVPAPEMDPGEARLELARRYLHIFAPTSAASFARWAGISPARGAAAFAALGNELLPVSTPVGDGSILAADEPALRASRAPAAPVRLLPSGDAYWLLQGRDRELLVADAGQRPQVWTPRVWPGAVLLHGEIAGTWRRDAGNVTILAWRPLSLADRKAVEAEAAMLPLPESRGPMRVRWTG